MILRPVGVLVFVHHDEPELLRVLCAHLWHVEQVYRFQQQIVEIEGAVVFQALDVFFVDLRELFPALAPSLRLEEVGACHGVLGVADLRQRHARLDDAIVYLKLLEDLLDERDLVGRVVDDEIARQTDRPGIAPEQPRAERMERRDPRADQRSSRQRLDARAHLFGGLVRERDREDFVALRVPLGKQVGDTLRDDARLAGAGAGKDEQRSVDVQNGVALFGIETL